MVSGEELTKTVDYQKLYEQVTALLDQARPLADQMVAAGSLKGGLRVGLETLLGVEFSSAPPEASGDPEEDPQGQLDPPSATPLPVMAAAGPVDLSEVSTVVGTLAGKALPHALYVQGAIHMAELLHDYGVTVQQETTARHSITARKEVRLQEIEVARAVMEQYLTATFDERRSNFQALFARLDRAQEQGDLQGLQLVLGSILDLAKSSPFKDLATFKQTLNDPSFVLEL